MVCSWKSTEPSCLLPFELQNGSDDPDPPLRADERRSSRHSAGAASPTVGEFADDAEDGQASVEMERLGGDKEEAGDASAA